VSARCSECRGSGYLFNPKTNHGEGCERCAGTGQVSGAKDIPPAIRAKVRERSGGVCEVCFSAPATDQHHRKFRSRSGEHAVENLLDVCGPGNAFGCHADAHSADPLGGVSINSWETHPEHIPFTDKLGRSWLLNTDGTKQIIAVPWQVYSMAGHRRPAGEKS
jgi:hypothetical protein